MDFFSVGYSQLLEELYCRKCNKFIRGIERFRDVDYITRLTNIYYLNDRDFQSMLEYVQSDEFCTVWTGFFNLLAIRDLGMYLTSAGIPVYEYVEVVGNFIGQPPVNCRMIRYSHGGTL